ncbi:MAG: acyl-CoA dehydrogenase family protein, partial [Armatimonadetes bacterium]|nr:acyl-CoA dehydrogenase family protein [Anaerolineae bacterium]
MTEEHEALIQTVRNFAQKEIAPIAAEHDESGEFPLDTIRKMGKMGLMGIEVPEEYGGAEMDTLAYVLTMIEVAKVDASHSTILSVNNSLYCHGLMSFGTAAQKAQFLTPV